MSNDRVGYVLAIIGGRKIRFELVRNARTLNQLEALCGPIPALWKRFQTGEYSIADVRTVLAAAHPYVDTAEGPRSDRIWGIRDHVPPFGYVPPDDGVPRRGASPSVIDRLMAPLPLEAWDTLAALVVAAAVVGLPKEQARFTDVIAEPAHGEVETIP